MGTLSSTHKFVAFTSEFDKDFFTYLTSSLSRMFSGFDKCVVVTRFGVVSLQDFWLAPGLASAWNWALGAHGCGGWAGRQGLKDIRAARYDAA